MMAVFVVMFSLVWLTFVGVGHNIMKDVEKRQNECSHSIQCQLRSEQMAKKENEKKESKEKMKEYAKKKSK